MIEDSRFGDQREVAAIKTQSSCFEESLRRRRIQVFGVVCQQVQHKVTVDFRLSLS